MKRKNAVSLTDLEYDLVVRPGADPAAIRLRFEGARKIELDKRGNLILKTAASDLVRRARASTICERVL